MSNPAPRPTKPYWLIACAAVILLAAGTLFYHQRLSKAAAGLKPLKKPPVSTMTLL